MNQQWLVIGEEDTLCRWCANWSCQLERSGSSSVECLRSWPFFACLQSSLLRPQALRRLILCIGCCLGAVSHLSLCAIRKHYKRCMAINLSPVVLHHPRTESRLVLVPALLASVFLVLLQAVRHSFLYCRYAQVIVICCSPPLFLPIAWFAEISSVWNAVVLVLEPICLDGVHPYFALIMALN